MFEMNLFVAKVKKLNDERDIVRRYFAAGLLIAFAITAVDHYRQQSRNAELQLRIDTMRHMQQQDSHEDKQKIYSEDIYFSAEAVIRLLQVTADSAMHGICYTALSRDGINVSLAGSAWSAAGVTALLRHLERAAIFSAMNLNTITHNEMSGFLQFVFDAREA